VEVEVGAAAVEGSVAVVVLEEAAADGDASNYM